MGWHYKKTFSRTAKREFAKKMDEIDTFCSQNGISSSYNNDSYYFTIDGVRYRVSNHSIEASNKGAYDRDTGIQMRELYHAEHRDKDTIYIHASKTRIMDIYRDLKDGWVLDGRGYRKEKGVK